MGLLPTDTSTLTKEQTPQPRASGDKESSETEFTPDPEPRVLPAPEQRRPGVNAVTSVPFPGPQSKSRAELRYSLACPGQLPLPTRFLETPAFWGWDFPLAASIPMEREGGGPAQSKPSPCLPRVCPPQLCATSQVGWVGIGGDLPSGQPRPRAVPKTQAHGLGPLIPFLPEKWLLRQSWVLKGYNLENSGTSDMLSQRSISATEHQ